MGSRRSPLHLFTALTDMGSPLALRPPWHRGWLRWRPSRNGKQKWRSASALSHESDTPVWSPWNAALLPKPEPPGMVSKQLFPAGRTCGNASRPLWAASRSGRCTTSPIPNSAMSTAHVAAVSCARALLLPRVAEVVLAVHATVW